MRRIGEPSEVEIHRVSARRAQSGIRTSVPGVVVSYDAAKQRCTVKAAVRIPDANGIPLELPQLDDVRVSWLRGGGYFASCPLAPGDAGMITFCEADFSEWLATGEVSDPVNVRAHGINPWFTPGGCVDGEELADAAADCMVIGKDGGPLIKIKDNEIEIGASTTVKIGGGSDFVALSAKVDAAVSTLLGGISGLTTWAQTHMHPTAGTGAPSPPAVPPPPAPSSPPSSAATKVKAT